MPRMVVPAPDKTGKITVARREFSVSLISRFIVEVQDQEMYRLAVVEQLEAFMIVDVLYGRSDRSHAILASFLNRKS